jgi:hypothetical protein
VDLVHLTLNDLHYYHYGPSGPPHYLSSYLTPTGSSPVQRQGEAVVPVPQYAEDYVTVEKNLEGLMVDVPDMPLEEIPRRDQRHTMGVSAFMGRLLRRVARTLVCYREHH